MNQKSWKGPKEVLCHKGWDVFVFSNRGPKKIADSKVQPYNTSDVKDLVGGNDEVDKNFQDWVEMMMETDPLMDSIGVFWIDIENNKCLDLAKTGFVVEVPRSEHGSQKWWRPRG